jgi:hypothetical protein
MPKSLVQEYAESLALLTGNDFECEACARLQSAILDFQTVPASPHGDAGLDGFSHNAECGYCCYGPERDAFKTNKHRENAIVDKFRTDLRRLCELDFEKRKLVRTENREMATILPNGRKLQHVTLLINWFESHRILGPLLTAFDIYKAASACRYVDAHATLKVMGPKELANQYAVDEGTIVRARHRVFARTVQLKAQGVAIGDPKGFEAKMTILREIRPDQISAIVALAEQFRSDWRMSLAFERELDETAPTLHRILEEDRQRILRAVSQIMIGAPEPWKELARASDIAKKILDHDFERLYGSIVQDVSSGEIARLIGECPVSWEKPSA